MILFGSIELLLIVIFICQNVHVVSN